MLCCTVVVVYFAVESEPLRLFYAQHRCLGRPTPVAMLRTFTSLNCPAPLPVFLTQSLLHTRFSFRLFGKKKHPLLNRSIIPSVRNNCSSCMLVFSTRIRLTIQVVTGAGFPESRRVRLLLSEDLDQHLVAAGEKPPPSAAAAAQDATRGGGGSGGDAGGGGGGGDAKTKANSSAKVRGLFYLVLVWVLRFGPFGFIPVLSVSFRSVSFRLGPVRFVPVPSTSGSVSIRSGSFHFDMFRSCVTLA